MANLNAEIRGAALLERVNGGRENLQIRPQAGCADEFDAALRRLVPASGQAWIAPEDIL